MCVWLPEHLQVKTLSFGVVPDTWKILSTFLCVCVCVLWEVRFTWCPPVNSSFLPPGSVCCLIGAPACAQKHPLFDHFALFDWHICFLVPLWKIRWLLETWGRCRHLKFAQGSVGLFTAPGWACYKSTSLDTAMFQEQKKCLAEKGLLQL